MVVDPELFELMRRTKKISERTSGIFDISYASMDKIWKFDGSMTRLPSKEEDGIALVNRIEGVECLLVNSQDDIVTTKNLTLNEIEIEATNSYSTIKPVSFSEK